MRAFGIRVTGECDAAVCVLVENVRGDFNGDAEVRGTAEV